MSRDWSLDLNFSDGFRWSEPPVLHVLGRDIPLAKYAEPRSTPSLPMFGRVRSPRHGGSICMARPQTAWQHAFEPVQLSDNPQVWLQLTPQSAAFAGVRADARFCADLSNSPAPPQTFIGQPPPAVTPTPLPPLGHDVSEPGSFDVILPVHVGYDLLKDKIIQAIGTVPPARDCRSATLMSILRRASSLSVFGLPRLRHRCRRGRWVYLTGALQVDADGHPFGSRTCASRRMTKNWRRDRPIVAQLHDKTNVDYGVAYQNLLNAANEKLTRPLKDGFRMEGHLIRRSSRRCTCRPTASRSRFVPSGELKILYGM